MARFNGYTTIGRFKNVAMSGTDLIKRDLLNTLSIREGEVPGRPTVGTNLWNFIFEPLDQITDRKIRNEIERITNLDPRISLVEMSVFEIKNGVIIDLTVTLYPNTDPEKLYIKFTDGEQSVQFVRQ